MKIINFKSHKFSIGKKVIVKVPYKIGTIILPIGAIGRVINVSYENLPAFGLINIKILEIDFGKHKVSMGESIADTYMDAYK